MRIEREENEEGMNGRKEKTEAKKEEFNTE
jgi:hypothetical protein